MIKRILSLLKEEDFYFNGFVFQCPVIDLCIVDYYMVLKKIFDLSKNAKRERKMDEMMT